MKAGIIVRADNGGLGSQTWEIWRHLPWDRTLVISMGDKSRGSEHLERFPGGWIAKHPDETLRGIHRFSRGLDVVFTVEGFYDRHFRDVLRDATPIVLANPELYSKELHNVKTFVPTAWEVPPRASVLPQPVALDRFTQRVRTECRTFYHVVAPAMLDRNGTNDLLAALMYVKHPCKLIIRSHEPVALPNRRGAVDVEVRVENVENYWDAWPDEADCLVLPRRYGGLCLPAMEAAAQGIPCIMPDLMPQRQWPWVLRVPAVPRSTVRMKGGAFRIHTTADVLLGGAMNTLLTDQLRVKTLSEMGIAWSERNSWNALMNLWRRNLGMEELTSSQRTPTTPTT